MNQLAKILVLVLVACSCAPSQAAPPKPAAAAAPAAGGIAAATGKTVAHVCGRVVYIVDGDTLDVEIPIVLEVPGEGGRELVDHGPIVIRVRLLADSDGRGCWCPESKTLNLAEKKRGLAAKANLERLALGKPCVVDLRLVSRRLVDYLSLERALAPVRVANRSLGQQQIDAKLASSTKGGKLGE